MTNLTNTDTGLYAQYEISDWYLFHPKIGYCKIDYLNEERITYSPGGVNVKMFCEMQNEGVTNFFNTIKDREFMLVRCRNVKNDSGKEYVLREIFNDSTFENYTEIAKSGEDHGVMQVIISTKSDVSKDFISLEQFDSSNITEMFKEQHFASEKAKELYDKMWNAKAYGSTITYKQVEE